MQNFNKNHKENKLASSKLRYSETITHWLTGVKCRATSVAKNVDLIDPYTSVQVESNL